VFKESGCPDEFHDYLQTEPIPNRLTDKRPYVVIETMRHKDPVIGSRGKE